MSRSYRRISIVLAALFVALAAAACGQEKVGDLTGVVSTSNASYKSYEASAEIFHQRCGGCHTLSYAAANGSGNNPRTYLSISGPNFNVRCERPVARVLYAIENGGFGGAYMPANIVVGAQARAVAEFVSKFAGRQAAVQPDSTPCQDQTMGALPATATGGVSITNTTTNPSNDAGNPVAAAAQSNPSPGGGQ
jgi:mono/diheme cytochrome c family protein